MRHAKQAFGVACTVLAVRMAVAGPPTSNLPVPCATGNCGVGGPNTWVTYGKATSTPGTNSLTINQQSSQAILNWSNFNIAAGASVRFNQPTSSATALNQVYSANPSAIFGNLSANGQVYLINQNGILFGPHAQVNVNTLIASTLNINQSTFVGGILNPTLLADKTPAFAAVDQNGNPLLGTDGKPLQSAVTVEPGAQITTTSGGRIMLLGQEVTNGGQLSSPNGQVILAAGQSAYLQASDDPTLRGLVVEVDGGGKAANLLTGQISAPTGNVTLVGLAVNQEGRVSATTSVNENGSIRLQAADTTQFVSSGAGVTIDASNSGALELGAQSLTTVTLDTSGATAVDAQVQSPSTITLVGHQIHLDGGSKIVAPAGEVTVHATQNPFAADSGGESLVPVDPESQVRIDSGAVIDVSGATVTLPVSSNIITAQLRGSELENYPLQRNGALRGQTVYFDVRADGGKGTTIANVQGEIDAIERTVAERSTVGGSVHIESEGDAVVAPAATINVSGGGTTFTGGVVATTELIGSDGRLHDIGSADPNVVYQGLINPTVSVVHFKWGEIDNFSLVGNAHYEQGYVQGASAGSVQFTARSLVLNGTLLGQATAGPLQRTASTAPHGGELDIGAPSPSAGDFLAPSVDFRTSVLPIVVAPGEPIAGVLNTLELPTQYLTSGGFTRTVIYSNGQIEIPSGVPLNLAPFSTFDLTAPRIDVLSSIVSPGGGLALTATTANNAVLSYSGRGGINIGNAVALDVSGRWVNDNPALAGINPTDPLATGGGSVFIDMATPGGELILGDGVRMDASAGAQDAAFGAVTPGSAGAITLAAPAADALMQIGSGLALAGFGVNGSRGGTLNLSANRIDIAHNDNPGPIAQSTDFSQANAASFLVSDALFSKDGFANFGIYATGPEGISATKAITQPLLIDSSANINVAIATRNINRDQFNAEPTGAALASFAPIGAQPPYSVPAASLAFELYHAGGISGPNSAVNSTNEGELAVAPGASISAPPRSTVDFSSATSLYMDGVARAPGGSISLTVENPPSTVLDVGYDPKQGIYLYAGAVLDVSGTTILTPSAAQLNTGIVLPGGTVNIVADRGLFFGAARSLIDVSGSHAVLDLAPSAGIGVVSQNVASAGGSISITAPEALTLDTTFEGRSGAPVGSSGPAGGSVSITLGRFDGYGPPDPTLGLPPVPTTPRTLLVGPVSQVGSEFQSVVDPASFERGGFSSLTLAADDAIDLIGGTSVSFAQGLSLQAPNLVAFGTAPVNLHASYVTLGPTNVLTQSANPASSGAGVLEVQAGLIELDGNLSLQGFAQTTLSAASDLRAVGVLNSSNTQLVGSLNAAGTLALGAREIYPTTFSTYTVSVQNGTIDTASTGSPQPVLSAGGSLSLSAATIDSRGSIEAPFGTIDLTASRSLVLEPGSLVSVSGEGQTVPFGQTQNGSAWVYQLTPTQILPISTPPSKQLMLNSPVLDVAKGATVNLSGGGDLSAFEFVSGLGGTNDVLASSSPTTTFAILPSLHTYAPLDAAIDSGTSFQPGEAVYLSAVPGLLAAGTYAMLPARYALLPGALLVSTVPSQQDLPLGQTTTLTSGATVVSGYLTTLGTNLRDSRTSGFSVAPGSYAEQLAEYDLTSANTFFSAAAAAVKQPAPQLPMDAGALTVGVGTSFIVDGIIDTKAAGGGLGATVDLSASNLEIVSQPSSSATGAVQISASSIEDLGAQSLLIGGTRSAATDGSTAIQVTAQDVTLAAGTTLSAPEVLLVGQDAVTVEAGARLSASGPATGLGGGTVTLDTASGSSALVRVSSGQQIEVMRPGASAATGTVDIRQGATLSAAGSITLGGTANTRSEGALESAGSISLSAPQISLGDASPSTPGLVLTNAQLALLANVAELQLISGSSIDLYDGVVIGTSSGSKSGIGSLVLDSSGLRGFGSSAGSVLAAGAVRLTDTQSSASASGGTGSGNLDIQGGSIELDAGPYGFSGFQNVSLSSRGAITANGAGSIASQANLTLSGTQIVGNSGADLSIDASGYAFQTRAVTGAATSGAPAPGLGVNFQVTAASIDHAGAFVLPSGQLTLDASGSLSVEKGALVNVAGVAQTVGPTAISTPGGSIVLKSDQGNVTVAGGASLDVSGGPKGGSAGSIQIDAAGTAQIDGTLVAHSAGEANGGSFDVAAAQLQDFATLNQTLNAGGFSQQQNFSIGSGDFTLSSGQTIRAHNVMLSINGGSLTVDGQIDARGPSGGAVQLSAANNLTLGATGQIEVDATGASASGGTVELDAAQGSITTLAGSQISASGAGGGGQIVFRAAAQGANGVAIGGLGGSITGADQILVRVVHGYDNVSTVDGTIQSTVMGDLANFATTAADIAASLGESTNPAFAVEAAVELRSTGDMTVAAPWDFFTMRPNGLPGELTLRAAGNLNVSSTISDGFVANGAALTQQSGPSWSYRLIGGADVNAANPDATVATARVPAGSGNVVIGSGAAVRTGTGSIRVSAAEDVALTDQTSVVFTSGVPVAGLTPTPALDPTTGTLNWATGGGNVQIIAGRDVIGAVGSGNHNNQFITNWQLRNNATKTSPTEWGIDFGQFQQNVGALGGGNVAVIAGRDVVNLSAVVPTSGVANSVTGAVTVYGGGNLEVSAGRDLMSGVYYVGEGMGSISAAHSIVPDQTFNGAPLGTILALGDGSIRATAGNGLEIESALNPTVIGQPTKKPAAQSYFFTYAPTSRVDLLALSGNLTLENGTSNFVGSLTNLVAQNMKAPAQTWYPGTVNATALGGDIDVESDFLLYPSASGNLTMRAANNVNLNQASIILEGIDPSLLPSPSKPQIALASINSVLLSPPALNPSALHQGDPAPVEIIAGQGDILGGFLEFPKPAELFAGRDINSVNLQTENFQATDVTLVQAGRDITYAGDDQGQISVGGPGYVDLFAGRTVDLAASTGIATLGATANPALPGPSGATVNVLASLTTPPAYAGFITHYFADQATYTTQLTQYVESLLGTAKLSAAAALGAFEKLPTIEQLPFVLSAFFNELNQSGLEATAGQKPGYARGFEAINTLFPGSLDSNGASVSKADLPYSGELSLSFSRIYTIAGGDINLLVPGGGINVGLATAPVNAPARSPSQLGIVAQGPGSVNAFTYGDVEVNQSRVFTLDGGNILIWSSTGNIDAGRGAKTSISAPPPTITVDPTTGLVTVNLAGAVAGSGIRTILTEPNVPPGNVNLIAPVGTVNAGDAGIGSAGNINIAAQTVLGASNINFGGTATGVPAATSNVAAGLTGASNAASGASNAAVEAANNTSATEKTAAASDAALGWLDVFVTGLGEENCKPDDIDCLKRQKHN
jgi:filamentous hemagglutinin family protein